MLAESYFGPEVRTAILQGYTAACGAAVAQIECFEVVAICRRLFDLSITLSAGAAQRGMRTEAVTAMREQIDAHRRVLAMLVERTGLRIPEIERLLA